MASSSEVLNDKANGCRLSRLLVDKGTQIMRAAFDVIHPPSTLAAAMNTNKRKLTALRYRVINTSQWDLLFPASGVPDSQKFDITLLTVLLREICGLASPATGWKVMPPDTDTSIAANILRIKLYRNEVYAHIKSTEIEDSIFETLWQKISKALIGLGVSKSELDELKEAPLSPEEADYTRRLEEWHNKEAELIEISLDTNASVKDLHAKVEKLEKRLQETEIVSEVDKLGNCNFSGEIENLNKKFLPGTREWLFDKVDTWFSNKDSDSNVMILTAGPGVGKSVFAAKVCQMYTERKQLAACHFCKYNKSDYRNPRMIIESLASSMCENVHGFKAKLTDQLKRGHSRNTTSDLFRVLLNDPLHGLEEHDPILLVIDALDESQFDSRSEFLEIISEEFPKLPQWVKILITSRPELPVQEVLQHFNPVVIAPDDPNNNKDLLKYFQKHLSSICDNDSVLGSLVWQCGGSFLFAYNVQKELNVTQIPPTEENLSELVPKGMSGFYEKQFERLGDQLRSLVPFKFKLKLFLEVLVAARDPLPLSLLPECLGLPGDAEYEVRRAINEVMSTILPVYDDCLIVYHRSLIDWLTSEGYKEHAFTVDCQGGHKSLWQACEKVFNQIVSRPLSELKPTPLIRYALAYGIYHMIQTADEASYHWSVNLKIVHWRTSICSWQKSRLKWEWEDIKNSSSNLNSVLLHELKWHIMLFNTVIFRNENGGWYLQSVANRTDVAGNDCDKRSAATALLKEGRYLWFEYLDATELTKRFSMSVYLQTDIACISVTPNEHVVAVGCKDGWISIFKLPNFQEVHGFQTTLPEKDLRLFGDENDSLWSCVFSSSGNRLVTCDFSSEIRLWDVNSGEFLARLEAGGLVDCCSFSEYGLLILASKQRFGDRTGNPIFGEESDVFTAWNALTLQRVDRRHVPVKFPCCSDREVQFIQTYNWDIIEAFQLPKALSFGRITQHYFRFLLPDTRYHFRYCLLYHTGQSIDWSQVPKWANFRCYMLPHVIGCQCGGLRPPRIVPVKVQGLYIVSCFAKSNIFNVADQTSVVSPISRPYFIECCCFSPDGSFYATCARGESVSILVWDTKVCKIVQVIHLTLLSVHRCWWSKKVFWIYDGGLVKIPVSRGQTLEPAGAERVKLHWKPTKLLTFSDVIIFADETYPVNVLRIIDDKVHYVEKLPVDDKVVCAAVSPCNSRILVTSATTIYICKEVQDAGSLHWVVSNALNVPGYCSLKDSEREGYQPAFEYKLIGKCWVSRDFTTGILSFKRSGYKDRLFLIDLCSGKITESFPDISVTEVVCYAGNVFSIGEDYMLKTLVAQNLSSDKYVAEWKTLYGFDPTFGTPLISCKDDIVAIICNRNSCIEFLRLRVPEQ